MLLKKITLLIFANPTFTSNAHHSRSNKKTVINIMLLHRLATAKQQFISITFKQVILKLRYEPYGSIHEF